MNYEAFPLILAFLLVVANVILWFLAKRDLNAHAAEKHAPTVAELEKVRATVEELIDVLEERAGYVERRLSALVEEANAILADSGRGKPRGGLRLDSPTRAEQEPKQAKARRPANNKFEVVEGEPLTVATIPDATKSPQTAVIESKVAEVAENPIEAEHTPKSDVEQEPTLDVPDLYLQVYALSDGGMDDVIEIARRTGLGQSEVEMVLSLRDRGN